MVPEGWGMLLCVQGKPLAPQVLLETAVLFPGCVWSGTSHGALLLPALKLNTAAV